MSDGIQGAIDNGSRFELILDKTRILEFLERAVQLPKTTNRRPPYLATNHSILPRNLKSSFNQSKSIRSTNHPMSWLASHPTPPRTRWRIHPGSRPRPTRSSLTDIVQSRGQISGRHMGVYCAFISFPPPQLKFFP